MQTHADTMQTLMSVHHLFYMQLGEHFIHTFEQTTKRVLIKIKFIKKFILFAFKLKEFFNVVIKYFGVEK